MTQEKFRGVLDEKRYSYEMEGNKIVVTRNGDVDLISLTSLPPGVEFKNKGVVWLSELTSLPPGMEFGNKGRVYLNSLTSIPPGVEFKNRGHINLKSLMDGFFNDWKGNIKGIDSKRLLNKMISLGLFER